jgi:hypothetical protein
MSAELSFFLILICFAAFLHLDGELHYLNPNHKCVNRDDKEAYKEEN